LTITVRNDLSKRALVIRAAGVVVALAAASMASATAALTQEPNTSPAAAAANAAPAADAASRSSRARATPAARQAATARNVSKIPATVAPTRYQPDRFAGRARQYYEFVWGIDSISVKLVESGELVRFSYHVLDPAKARVLNDKQSTPSLIDPRAGVSLVVPTMEKVGQLRQSAPPESDRSYWMAFSNKGRLVRRGDRVDVVIGGFHAGNLVVD
jgi:hypothetical protein